MKKRASAHARRSTEPSSTLLLHRFVSSFIPKLMLMLWAFVGVFRPWKACAQNLVGGDFSLLGAPIASKGTLTGGDFSLGGVIGPTVGRSAQGSAIILAAGLFPPLGNVTAVSANPPLPVAIVSVDPSLRSLVVQFDEVLSDASVTNVAFQQDIVQVYNEQWVIRISNPAFPGPAGYQYASTFPTYTIHGDGTVTISGGGPPTNRPPYATGSWTSVPVSPVLVGMSTNLTGHYQISPGQVVATDAALDTSGTLVTLNLNAPLTPGMANILAIRGVTDIAGTPVPDGTTIAFAVDATGTLTSQGPVSPALPVGQPVIESLADKVQISWSPSGGMLQSSPRLGGLESDWTNVGTENPAIFSVDNAARFFRVLR